MNLFAPLEASGEAAPRDGDRLPTSVVKIMEGALRALASRGARRLSMSDIIDASGVSRGTLYRYFSTKEEVMSAVAEFVCVNFETGVRDAAAQQTEPMERLRAVMRFFARFTMERSPERMLEVEPTFYLEFFRSHFTRHTAAVGDALTYSFDYLEQLGGTPIDRAGIVEALVRMQLSTLIVPADQNWIDIWEAAPDRFRAWILELAGIMPASEEK